MATPSVGVGLEKYLSQPGATFVAVEAGADTKPLQDLEAKAREQGYVILKAAASRNGPTYVFEHAFHDASQKPEYKEISGRLQQYAEDLQISPPIKLQTAFVISPSGLQAAKADAAGTNIGGEIYTSMLDAVSNFMRDSLGKEGPHERHQLGNSTVEMYSGPNFTLVGVYEGDVDKNFKGDLQKLHCKIDEKFGNQLKDWDGVVIPDVENTIKENLFDTGKYAGEHDVDTLKRLCEQRRWRALKALENVAREKEGKVLVYLDGLDAADAATLQDIRLAARSANHDNFTFIGTYHTDSVKDELYNKDLQRIVENLKCDNIAERHEIKSPRSIYELIPELDANAKKILQLSAIGLRGKALRKASGMRSQDYVDAYLTLQTKHLLLDDKVASGKLADKLAKEMVNPQTYLVAALAMESEHKEELPKFSSVLSELYEKAGQNEEAAKWAKASAEAAFRNANLAGALNWYRKHVDLSNNGKEKLESLEKAVELGFYQITEGWSDVEADISKLEQLALQENDVKRRAVAKLMRGKVCVSGMRLGEAIEELESAGKIFVELGENDLYASSLLSKGVALLAKTEDQSLTFNDVLNYCNESVKCYEQVIEVSKTTRNIKTQIKATGNIGRVHRTIGDLLQAAAVKENPELAISSTIVEPALEEYKLAVKWLEDSLQLAGKTFDDANKMKILDNLAATYSLCRRLDEAQKASRECIALSETNKGVLASVYTTMSYIAFLKNNADGIIDWCTKAMQLAQIFGDKEFYNSARANRAEGHMMKGLEDMEGVNLNFRTASNTLKEALIRRNVKEKQILKGK